MPKLKFMSEMKIACDPGFHLFSLHYYRSDLNFTVLSSGQIQFAFCDKVLELAGMRNIHRYKIHSVKHYSKYNTN